MLRKLITLLRFLDKLLHGPDTIEGGNIVFIVKDDNPDVRYELSPTVVKEGRPAVTSTSTKMVAASIPESVAERITAYFNVDLALLRGYGLAEEAQTLLAGDVGVLEHLLEDLLPRR